MSQLILPWPDSASWKRWTLHFCGVVFALYIAYEVRAIWLPLGLAFLLATVLDPVVDRMELRGWRRAPATAFIFFSFLALVGGTLTLAFPYLLGQLGTVQGSIAKFFPDSSPHGLAMSFTKLKVPGSLVHPLVQGVIALQNGLLKSSSWLSEYGMSILGNMVWVILVPIVGYYALRDYHLLLGKALLLAPKQHRHTVQVYVAELSAVFARYLRGLAIVSVLNGLATWGLMAALRVPNALLLGVIAGVLYSVPYVGALTTVGLTAAIAFAGGGVPMLEWAVGTSMVLHQLIFDQIVTPRILGGQVGIHPIVSIVALLVGNLLLGVVGMVLAVPIAACIQIGVVALVPKLGAVLEFNPDGASSSSSNFSRANYSEEAKDLAQESQDEHVRADAQDNPHVSVLEAVDQLEALLETGPPEETVA
jgi:predicted PurR-regulated permease PerM